MSDWPIEDLPERLRRFQHGAAEMLLAERPVGYLSTKVIGEGDWDGDVWVQEEHWTLQIRYVRTDPASNLQDAEYMTVSTSGDSFFGNALSDLRADEVLPAVEAGWISFLDEPEREEPTTYQLRWLTGDDRETAWALYGWEGLWP